MRTPFLATLLLPALASAQVPATIAYQGRLLDSSGSPLSGVVTMQFAIFDGPTGSGELWCETQSVALTNGYYAVSLGGGTQCPSVPGKLTAAFAGVSRYLELSVGVGGTALTPRQQIASVPFALVAGETVRAASNGAWWHFEEGSGTTVADLSGNGNTLTLAATGVAWIANGHTGSAVQYPGTTGGLARAPSSPSLLLTEAITLEAWVYPVGTVAQGPVIVKEGSFALSINNGQLQAGFFATAHATWEWQGSGYVPNNAWAHVAATYDGVTIRCYVNEVLTAVAPYAHGPLATNANPLLIGGRPDQTAWFNGRIDEVRISPVAKSFQMNTLNGAYRVVNGVIAELTTPRLTWTAMAEPTLNYTKKSSTSVLRIEYSDTMRAAYVATFGMIFGEVLIDDLPVASPFPCSFAHYQNTNSVNNNFHIPTHILCYAQGVIPGPHKFSLRWKIADTGQGYIGWERGQRVLEVQELNLVP